MEQQITVFDRITDCARTIFSFSLSRTGSRQEAEDLSQEIVAELFRSAGSLRDEKTFYGWMWGTANNVYKAYLRKQKKSAFCELDENMHAAYSEMPEAKLVESEELNLLRRELSLLSERYRSAAIKYYVENKSCLQISQELDTSVEMVKYLLFKARKLLKEGMSMTREYGEKSYNPGIFNMDYWGTGPNDVYWSLFKRRLPGNILLSAYYTPLTVEEISLELGVAAPYLEDELAILLKHNFIKQLQNGKYQTNIIIFTESCEREIYEKSKDTYFEAADKLYAFISENEKRIRSIGFEDSSYPSNRLLWLTAHIALLNAINCVEDEYFSSRQGFPLLSNGSRGYIWGLNRNYDIHHFNGIYWTKWPKDAGDWLHTCNYKIIEKCQLYHPSDSKNMILIDAAKGCISDNDKNSEITANLIADGYLTHGKDGLYPNFPVLSNIQYSQVCTLLQPIIDQMVTYIKNAIAVTAKVLQNHVPQQLKDQCDVIANITTHTNTMASIVEQMCGKGYLIVPDTPEKLSMFIVLK